MLEDPDLCRRKAEEMLDLAAKTTNLAERGRFIDLAVSWHNKAKALEHPEPSSEE